MYSVIYFIIYYRYIEVFYILMCSYLVGINFTRLTYLIVDSEKHEKLVKID